MDANTGRRNLSGKNVVRIITRDAIRDLLIPNVRGHSHAEFWPEQQITHIKTNARVSSVEDKMEELKIRVECNEKLKEESEKRKHKLREIDTAKVTFSVDSKDASVDEITRDTMVKLLDRAFFAKQEQVKRKLGLKFSLNMN